MNRDDFKCMSCGSQDDTLNVHHYYYIDGKMIWEYPDELLITLCKFCHNDWHKIKKNIERYFTITNEELYLVSEIVYYLVKQDEMRLKNILKYIKERYG